MYGRVIYRPVVFRGRVVATPVPSTVRFARDCEVLIVTPEHLDDIIVYEIVYAYKGSPYTVRVYIREGKVERIEFKPYQLCPCLKQIVAEIQKLLREQTVEEVKRQLLEKLGYK